MPKLFVGTLDRLLNSQIEDDDEIIISDVSASRTKKTEIGDLKYGLGLTNTTYNVSNAATGVLKRLDDLEADVSALQSSVSSLQSAVAALQSSSHTH